MAPVAPVPATRAVAPAEPPPIAKPRPLPPELQLVYRLIGEGQYAAARTRADRWIATHPDDGRAHFLKGLSFHKVRDYASAEPLFVRAIELEPGDPVMHHFLGYCRFHLGDLAGSRIAFEAHLARMPQESDSHFGLGLVELEDGNLDAAEARFLHAIALIRDLETSDPDKYRLRRRDLGKCHAQLGDIAFARGAYEQAAELLRTAIKIDPNHYGAYFTLSQTLRRLGREAQADRMLERYEQVRAARHAPGSAQP